MNPLPPLPVELPAPAERRVSVQAPGRLHLGFLDPAATLGRRFGSLGLVLDEWHTRVDLGAAQGGADELSAAGPEAEAELPRAMAHLHALKRRTGQPAPLRLHLAQVLPAHAGLGSGTQLALAVGRAFARWHRLALSTSTLAHGLGRGLRSGIGIAGFDQGGLLLDGGPGADGHPAPLLARLALPSAWRVLLVTAPGERGLSGAQERAALAQLPPLSQAQAAEICHQTLMQVLPGAAGGDFAAFAQGVSRIQQLLGEHFAPAQDGEAYTHPAIGRLMRWLTQQSPRLSGQPVGVGQSSWGPTAFAFVASQAQGEALMAAARAAGLLVPGLQFSLVAPRNEGARVVDSAAPASAAPSRHASAESLWRWAQPDQAQWRVH
jgi:beta-ribofuranosylaminobenzene 5'-phosphate synthase